MKPRIRLLGLVPLLVLLTVAGCDSDETLDPTSTKPGAGGEASTVPDVVGTWQTTYGPMIFDKVDGDVTATYSAEGGRLEGDFNELVYSGTWEEPSSRVECDEERNGTTHWGQFEFTFAQDLTSFEGIWSYCIEEPTRPWKGTLDE